MPHPKVSWKQLKEIFKKCAVDVTIFSNRFISILLKNFMIRNRVKESKKEAKTVSSAVNME